MEDIVYSLNSDFVLQQNPVNNQPPYLFDAKKGSIYKLNKVSFDFIRLMDGERPLSEIVRQVNLLYDVEPKTIKHDLGNLLSQLLESNALTERRCL